MSDATATQNRSRSTAQAAPRSIPNFASDNWAPGHPVVLEAIARCNSGHVPAYGADQHTAAAESAIREHLGATAIPFFAYTGTGANVLAIGACVRPYEGVICADTAHILVSETGAPEWHLGTRLIPIPSPDGKVTVEAMHAHLAGRGSVSSVQPRVLSITQATEYGTVYTPGELRALCDAAHGAGLYVHMDGARLANAAAALGASLGAVSGECGVDVLSFGATKNGGIGAEAVVFFDPQLAEGFGYRRKQGMQLASKMRYVAVQFTALLTDDLWRTNARHANAMARALGDGLAALHGVRLTQPVESNQVFAEIPAAAAAQMQRGGHFHQWNAARDEYRLVCSWDTAPEDVSSFLAHAHHVLGA